MQDEGLINEDAVTARGGQAAELMAQNEIAFIFTGGSFGADVTELNPDVEVGLSRYRLSTVKTDSAGLEESVILLQSGMNRKQKKKRSSFLILWPKMKMQHALQKRLPCLRHWME